MHEPHAHTDNAAPRRDRLIGVAIVLAALVLMGGLIALFWKPAPPKVVVMSTGPVDGAYHAFGLQYQQILARSGIRLVLLPSSGAVENLQRLRTRRDGVSLALLQGGIAPPGDEPALFSLGGMFYEPLWVFSRGPAELGRLAALAGGRRVAAGVPDSGTQAVARAVLDATLTLKPVSHSWAHALACRG